MLAGISEGTWAFLGVFITNVVVLVGLFYRQGKQGRSVDQINRAVNHQSDDQPTLIERVVTVERRTEEIAEDTREHREWEYGVFSAIASHVGLKLPKHHRDET
jgi:hypothetical protein